MYITDLLTYQPQGGLMLTKITNPTNRLYKTVFIKALMSLNKSVCPFFMSRNRDILFSLRRAFIQQIGMKNAFLKSVGLKTSETRVDHPLLKATVGRRVLSTIPLLTSTYQSSLIYCNIRDKKSMEILVF